jgi:uncharacterized protein YjbJ (UPF0337 family)
MERSSRRTVSLAFPQSEEKIVDKEHVKGAADKAKGAVKDALGKMTGDKKMQVEGKVTSRTPHVKPTNANLDAPI